MTDYEKQVIKDNLTAFKNNFGNVRIEKEDVGPGYFVFYPADKDNTSWIQFCYNLDYLNGWLYGVVQGFVRGEFKKSCIRKD